MTTSIRDPDYRGDTFAKSAALAAAAYGGTGGWPLAGSRAEVGLWSTALRAALQMVEALWVWHDRGRQRRELMALSDHMLRDIGVSRAEALAEATRPFWRA